MARSTFDKLGRHRMAGRIAARFMRVVAGSSKVVTDLEGAQQQLRDQHPAILAMWHGQFMMLPVYAPRDIPIANMVARHGDAEIIGEALKTFDMALVRGGGAAGRRKDRGGVHAFREALRLLEAGTTVAMTADVPPGPARRAGEGIIKLAQKSGRPIIPVAIATSRFHALDTWSRMTLNLPFSRVAALAGEPILVPADADHDAREAARRSVDTALNAITEAAYSAVGADAQDVRPAASLSAADPPEGIGLALRAYRGATRALSPALPLVLKYRERRGKEEPARRRERLGHASLPRPQGELIWLHAASVGETNATLPLLETLKTRRPQTNFLLTTGTVTSAKLAAARLGDRCIHQYAPLDAPALVSRFLDHWQPDLICLTESEIWPNTILLAHDSAIAMVLINARMSERSFRRWRRNRRQARPLFSRLRLILAQNERLARRFRELGARDVRIAGNLKVDAPKLPVDKTKLQELENWFANRPMWLAASTHPGEEKTVFEALAKIRQRIPDVLLILVPRHPERGSELQSLADEHGFRAVRRSVTLEDKAALAIDASARPSMTNVDVYIADTLGELGLFYSLAPIAFIGGSLTDRGGQNPLEAIQLGTTVLTGPSHYNFADAHRELAHCDGIVEVHDPDSLSDAVIVLLGDNETRTEIANCAETALSRMAGALAVTTDALDQLLEERRRNQMADREAGPGTVPTDDTGPDDRAAQHKSYYRAS